MRSRGSPCVRRYPTWRTRRSPRSTAEVFPGNVQKKSRKDTVECGQQPHYVFSPEHIWLPHHYTNILVDHVAWIQNAQQQAMSSESG